MFATGRWATGGRGHVPGQPRVQGDYRPKIAFALAYLVLVCLLGSNLPSELAGNTKNAHPFEIYEFLGVSTLYWIVVGFQPWPYPGRKKGKFK